MDASTANAILTRLPRDEREALLQSAERVHFQSGDEICRSGRPAEQVYFLETGFCSVMDGDEGTAVEISQVGPEGMVGVWVALGRTVHPFRAMALSPTSALAVAEARFHELMAASPPLTVATLAFAQDFTNAVAETCRANARLTIESRLALWILRAQDRLGADTLVITHEILSQMLGVRRPGVTVALQMLEGRHALKSTRGKIEIRDRTILRIVAGARDATDADAQLRSRDLQMAAG